MKKGKQGRYTLLIGEWRVGAFLNEELVLGFEGYKTKGVDYIIAF